MKRYLIIGNGVAGASAAEKIRLTDPEGRITMLSSEADAYYSRPRLPEYLAGEAALERITLHGAQWYAAQDIDLRLNVAATAVDPVARTVTITPVGAVGAAVAAGAVGAAGPAGQTAGAVGAGAEGKAPLAASTAGGEILPYDELLLATGASSLIPPIPGADRPGVFALRTAADARAINQAAKGRASAILVGGGLLGLEAGAALARMGLKIQVAEYFDRLLPRQMDAAGTAKLQAVLEGQGFSFFLGAKSKEISGSAGALTLSLEDGRTLEGALVLFSAGIRGNVELAKQLGLAMDKGVTVDDRMATSLQNIWAAGDHVEHRGRLYGMWMAAKEQGDAAGVNMAGGQAVYQGTVPSQSLKVAGVDLTAAGDIDADSKLQAVVWQDAKAYRKVVLDGGVIKGYIFFGVSAGIKECREAMRSGRDVRAFATSMAEADFDFKRLVD